MDLARSCVRLLHSNGRDVQHQFDFQSGGDFRRQIFCGDPADRVLEAQEQQESLADDTAGLGGIGSDRQPDRSRPEQHSRSFARPLPLLSHRLHHLLEPKQFLYTLHHNGLSLLQDIQHASQQGEEETR
ncbi:hypothetical protein TSAR_010299 [Trichomalopsis sarcophagae]|uniref:Uncharacterized protein n=1 Tax=Trichomalopsis sarcophagae TaxID=543379 RepID=A0A232EZH4_9HYME|nr:hypothetical protein TSAR_010299 [Trichomalopsis sarcophagae]